jgi:hypothetical protein
VPAESAISSAYINENHKIITYDVKDLYVNIPIQEILRITKFMLLKGNNTQIKKL